MSAESLAHRAVPVAPRPYVRAIATPAVTRSRGRTAAHDPETLLDLVAAGVNAAVAAGDVPAVARVSMSVFNRLRAQVDAVRGVDPAGPQRTPTAEAIQMRFKQLAGRPVAWSELVCGALLDGRRRTMWLAALRREDARDDLTDDIVAHALRLVAARRGVRGLPEREYEQARDELVADDKARNDEDGILEWLLPTRNQVVIYCGGWPSAVKLAGLQKPPTLQRGRKPVPPPQPAGMSVVSTTAFYAALNGTWPSYAVLQDFARRCDVRLQAKPADGWASVRGQAAVLLLDAGIEPPTRTRGGGKGKRMTYRYPVDGIPGAPRRRPRASRSKPDRPVKGRLVDETRRDFAILSLRVWLASLAVDARRARRGYVAWQVGTMWTSAGVFDKGLGGFTALKQQAAGANDAVRRAGGDPLADALARAQELRSNLLAVRRPASVGQPDATATPEPLGQPVPFADALSTVLAGPHAEAQPPKQ